MPEIAFSTLSCPDWSWREILESGRRFGYDGVEVRLLERETDLLSRPEFRAARLAERRRELRAAGFRVCGLASSVKFDDVDRAARERQLDTGRRYVDLAVELGAEFVRVFGDTLPVTTDEAERTAALDRIAAGLDELGDYAAGQGITVLIETHGDFCASPPLRAVCERVSNLAVGVLWDTHHPWRFFGEPPAETFARIGPWVRHTHWKDSLTRAEEAAGEPQPDPTTAEAVRCAAEAARALMAGHRHADYVAFGEGEFPAAECVGLLGGAGYAGWYCLEWEKMWHPEIADAEMVLPSFPSRLRRLLEAARPD